MAYSLTEYQSLTGGLKLWNSSNGGELDYDALANEFDDNLAMELFQAAGVPVVREPDE